MKRVYVGRYYDLGSDLNKMGSREKLLQYAIGEALMDAGVRLVRDISPIDQQPFVPIKVEIEVVEKGWDLQVRIRMEDKDEVGVTGDRGGLSEGDTRSETSVESRL